jgi:hypothetical protein
MIVQALWNGRTEAVRLMASFGFDVAITSEGATLLHMAAWRGQVDMVKLLVSLGAPVNVRDTQHGSSPIAWAAHGSRWCRSADDEYCAIADVLIDAGSEYAATFNKAGEPPEALASPGVRAHLVARGFAPGKT